jgi:hypothetical protein
VLPDGTIAKVDVDFDTLRQLSEVARRQYGLGGSVQHGASTLPEDAFGKFVEAQAVEVHLATNFMTMFYDHIPEALRMEIYAWLDATLGGERRAGMSDEQFYYKTRKNAIGPFKARFQTLPADVIAELESVWETQFAKLFKLLGIQGTRAQVDSFVKPVPVQPLLKDYVKGDAAGDETSDLAD